MGRARSLRVAGAALALAVTAGVTTGVEPTHPGTLDPTLFSPVVVSDEPVISDFEITQTPRPRRPVVDNLETPEVVKLTATPGPVRQEPANKFPSVAEAKAYARSRIGSTQFSCLDRLWTRESNWRVHALNKSSGAYGIPQALPGDKMARAGADWRDNAITQVKWGLGYIGGRYGDSCSALRHSDSYGWY